MKEVRKKFTEQCDAAGVEANAMVTRAMFPYSWKKALQEGATPEIIKSGFRDCGILPFDPDICAVNHALLEDK